MPEDELRRMRNCDGTGDGSNLDFFFDPTLKRCPWAAIAELDPFRSSFGYVAMWRRWTSLRVLPYGAKSMGELPQPIFEAFEICASVDEMMERYGRAREQQQHRQTISEALQSLVPRVPGR